MLSITRLGLGLALAGLTACASGGGTNDPAVATAPAVSVQPASQRYVATRSFRLREAPTMDGAPLDSFRTGDRFSGRARSVDEVWSWMELERGNHGYVFGRPYRIDDAEREQP